MIDKRLYQITDILNDFLKPFDCVAVAGTDFAYYPGSNTIEYALVVGDYHEKTFNSFCKKLFPEITANIFLWSFLHELGHNETVEDFEDEDWQDYINKINSCPCDEEYYNLPIEYAATYWAGKYMLNHQNEIKNLWNKLAPTILNFYKENEVKIDDEA